MKESDWKKFKVIKERAIDKFCSNALEEFHEILSDDTLSNHDKYLSHYQKVHDLNVKMAQIFDGHSRSSAGIQLLGMRAEGLVDESLVDELSEEFKDRTNPQRFDRC